MMVKFCLNGTFKNFSHTAKVAQESVLINSNFMKCVSNLWQQKLFIKQLLYIHVIKNFTSKLKIKTNIKHSRESSKNVCD